MADYREERWGESSLGFRRLQVKTQKEDRFRKMDRQQLNNEQSRTHSDMHERGEKAVLNVSL